MSRLATLLSVLVVVAARTTWKDLDNYNFGKYVEEFGFSWKDAEYTKREQIFVKELARVRAHNAAGKSWKEGVNKFSAMTVSEKQVRLFFRGRHNLTRQFSHQAYMGRSKGAFQKQQPKFKQPLPSDFVIKPVSELSTRRDWRESNIVSPVKDQGHCGSCWAFASTAVIESHVAKASGLLFELSVQQVIYCRCCLWVDFHFMASFRWQCAHPTQRFVKLGEIFFGVFGSVPPFAAVVLKL